MKLIQIQLPALLILQQLQSHGYEAYIVGGAVRDLLRLSEESQENQNCQYFDYDFTTNATPEQIQALFTNSFYENTFGTVSVAFSHLQEQFSIPHTPPSPNKVSHSKSNLKIIDLAKATKIHDSLANALPETEVKPDTYLPVYEITTFRSESNYTDHRRPEQVSWGSSLQEDLSRRDFTCNAMALEISQAELQSKVHDHSNNWLVPIDTYTLHDPFSGQTDLKNAILKTVGTAQERFAEDALRMLRAIRFAVQLDVDLDPNILQAITDQYADLAHISWERIQTEFLKMLSSNNPARAINLLDQTKLLEIVLPELLETKNVEQAGHHTTDVWTHSIDALASCPSPDPIVRLATLLHDIGKPRTFTRQNGTITFYNHDIIGSRIAKKVAQRLRLSKKDIERIFILVRYHMFHYQQHNTDAAIRRFMRKVGLAHIDDILDLREGDRLGSGARKTSWRLEEMKQRMIEQLHQPMEIKDLAISGHDLMEQLEMQPGPQLGAVLKQLFEEVLDNADLNTREFLLHRAKEILDLQK
jgi:poly(A) polymerase/tRNA nucleotidyltransferase (CCA-adding enzyme)